MKKFNQSIFNSIFLALMAAILTAPFNGIAQLPQTQEAKVLNPEGETTLRPRPICEEEQQLVEKYGTYQPRQLVKELIKEDTAFTCPGIRGTTRISGRRAVIQSLISQNRDEAFPYLIKVVKSKKPELSALALELVQYADEQLLR
ncbi:MAG: hypothetical protein KDD63_02640, partial [Bacteroidetes bacterium]|nr:hypothetical protein [Bacteroidota bacterium]